MQPYIDAAWGWEELLQREGFVTTLPARSFQILHDENNRLGSFHLSNCDDHLLLDMILVEPDWQRRGFGRLMMDHIKSYARQQQLPIQLRVLRTNPAVQFHRASGFETSSSDDHSLMMTWAAD